MNTGTAKRLKREAEFIVPPVKPGTTFDAKARQDLVNRVYKTLCSKWRSLSHLERKKWPWRAC